MFDSLLIANRGEIACRVIHTAQRMGIRTVAIFSDADADALHVRMADDARRVGGAAAADSYLSIPNIIAAARDSGAKAVHPGYGFLAENAEFAAACAAAGITFVGPSPDAIRTMGAKVEAKQVVEAAGVPVLPDYRGTAQRRDALRKAAAKVGFPLLIKASAGGGGRGMRLVEDADGFDAALDGARREAKAAFGDDRVFFERYLPRARHVEVQVFGDNAGRIIHLFERDCSSQRRHQKLIEEAPAPGLSPELRQALGAAAVAAAESVRYRGAGTVEFLVDPAAADGEGGFYFLEMNTRLQVEHPVTEMITGLDLVEWQLRIAAGEDLPCGQSEIEARGHAVEARLYAEDPARGFLPASGRLERLRFAEESDGVRIEAGIREGDTVSRHYDTLLAKLVVHAASREQAIDGLRRALAESVVAGPATNKAFLAAVLRHAQFRTGDVDTQFVERNEAALLADADVPRDQALALAAHAERESLRVARDGLRHEDADCFSPWDGRDGWRLFGRAGTVFRFRDGAADCRVTVADDGMVTIDSDGRSLSMAGEYHSDGQFSGTIDDEPVHARILCLGAERQVSVGERCRTLDLVTDGGAPTAMAAGGGILTAPLPASVVAVHVQKGQRVARGEALMVLEAMKMEHVITAPDDGSVAAVHYAVGAQVEEGAQLIGFETD
jgi:3-methylcrotonyl-CoA carboxylase alpha subunit